MLKDRAITTDLTSQFTATLADNKPVGVVGLFGHNLSADATWRIRLYDDSDELLEDSGIINAWPAAYSSLELAWENPNFWTGIPDDEDRSRFTPQAIWMADKNWYAKKAVIDIVDENNTDGFVAIGRGFLSEVYQPEYNFSYGVQWTFSDPTQADEALDSTEYFDAKPQKREVTMAFDWLSEQEAFSRMFRLRRDLGVSGEVLFFHRINVDSTYPQRTMLARPSQIDPVAHPDAARHSHALSLKEIL
ncbi:hypothetical protein C0068_08175 [Zhongshania marina]|uniref:Uncharacterized protein n=1 Tax=Zhongshania marina TaxID=2304603 RepID=A0A2S4HGE3_9GAMM|nr:hypothetical protein C0068_08175 [Marortus luteolus]